MNITVARKLHERRFRPNPVVTTGELINMIGSEGMQEALLNRWLVADMDSGFLMLNQNGGKMQELESACRCHCGKTDCACPAVVEAAPTTAMPMREAFAGPGLPRPGGNAGSPTGSAQSMLPRPQAPLAPTSQTSQHDANPQIGDEVMMAENGQDFQGKVASIDQDGKMRLSFGSNKPSMDRAYANNELRKVASAQPNA